MKRKTKTYTKKWKTRLNPISAWSSHFFLLKLEFIGKNQKEGIPGRLGEQTLPQLTQDGCGNAARTVFPRPWCGQVATPSWWRSLIWWFSCIFFWFSRFCSRIWRNSLWLLASTAWFREDSSQPVFNLSDKPRFSPDSLISNFFWIKSEFSGLLGLFLFPFF